MTWDITTPAGTEAVSQGDDRIREFKSDVQAGLRANDATLGNAGAFPGADTANPKFHYRGLKGTTAQRPAAGNYGLYFNTDTSTVQRDNGTTWEDVFPVPTLVKSSVMTIFTSSGTWTKATLNPKFVRVTVVGGGGGASGGASTGASNGGASGGGGGGGTAIRTILAASLGATETVTVGAGGTAGVGASSSGGSGGASSFGAFCTANGGSGSTSSSNNTSNFVSAGAAGGTATGGDINMTGGAGLTGFFLGVDCVSGGHGGATFIAGRTLGAIRNSSGSTNGTSGGANTGAGGSGGMRTGSSGASTGGAGGTGIVIVEEFY